MSDTLILPDHHSAQTQCMTCLGLREVTKPEGDMFHARFPSELLDSLHMEFLLAKDLAGFLKSWYPQNIYMLIGFSIINHPAIGVPPYMETSISQKASNDGYLAWNLKSISEDGLPLLPKNYHHISQCKCVNRRVCAPIFGLILTLIFAPRKKLW